jgi:bifunctional non-homologous end joining protein LigD
MARSKARAKIDRKVAVSNPDKVLYPGGKFTKGDVVEYYRRVARFLLPHFRNRSVTLKRYPDVCGHFDQRLRTGGIR